MTDTIESLIGFSEFALALAGFAAIALVLGRREDVFPSGSAYVVQFMVLNSLGPAMLALLAAVLFRIGLSEPVVARICSAAYLLPAVFFVALSRRRERSLANEDGLVLPAGLSRAMWSGALLAHLVQISVLIGFPFEPSLGIFLFGLWILLLLAGTQFVALLFVALS